MYRDYQNYDVLEDGRIWSKYSKKFLKPTTNKDGYQRVCLYDNEGKRDYQFVHRVCWIAVNGREVPEGMELNHLDEDKTNNAIWNLQLCTKKENCNHGTRNSRVAKANTNHLEKSKRVGAYKDGEIVMVFPSTREAGRNCFKQSAVSACCNGKLPHYKGYEWRYFDEINNV